MGVANTGRDGVEIFLTRQITENTWEALVRPGKKMRTGERIIIAKVKRRDSRAGGFGERVVRLDARGDLFECLIEWGICAASVHPAGGFS